MMQEDAQARSCSPVTGYLAASAMVTALFVATSSFATILSVTAVQGVPSGGAVQFGSAAPGDLSIVLQLSIPPEVTFSIGGIFISPPITAAGVIPGPYLDVTLTFNGTSVTPQIAGPGPSDFFFVTVAGARPGDPISYLVSDGNFTADRSPRDSASRSPGADARGFPRGELLGESISRYRASLRTRRSS